MPCRARAVHHDSGNKVQGFIRGRTNVAVVHGKFREYSNRRKNVRQNERLAVSLKKLVRVKLQPRGLV